MRAEELFNAIDDIDADLLYDARTYRRPKRQIISLISVAAAIVLLVAVTILLYTSYAGPSAYIWLESHSAVTLAVNDFGKVIEVIPADNAYASVRGYNADLAVNEITREMIDTADLNDDENTVLIGVSSDKLYGDPGILNAARTAFDKSGFSGSAVEVYCSKGEDTTAKISPPKQALINIISCSGDAVDTSGMDDLNVNDLNLIAQDIELSTDSLKLSGKPSDSKYIGSEAARERAIELTELDLDSIDSLTVVYGVYKRSLIYRVRLRAGDRGEEYFFNASTGATEQTFRADSAELDELVGSEMQKNSASTEHVAQTEPPESGTEYPETHYKSEQADSAENKNEQAPDLLTPATEAYHEIQSVTEAESADCDSVDVTMMELSFVTAQPPDTAAPIGYSKLFEGQCFEPRTGAKKNKGSVTIITSRGQLNEYLNEYNYQYKDKNGEAFTDKYDNDYFRSHFLIASVCTFSDASYYNTVTDIKTDGSILYIEDSLSYGEPMSGEYYCNTLSLYEISADQASPYCALLIY